MFTGWGVIIAWLTACSGVTIPSAPLTLSPLPSASPILSAAITATSTVTPTATPTPSPTSTPSGISLEPRSTPLKEWSGIPVMPGALAGEAGKGFYAFTTRASLENIAAYYLHVMTLRGWSFLGANQNEQIALLLIFGQDEQVVSVAIFDVTPYMVMLVYYPDVNSLAGRE